MSEKLNDDLMTWIDDEWVNYLVWEFSAHPFSAEFKIINNSLCVEMCYHNYDDWFVESKSLSLYFNKDDFSKEVNDKLATLKKFDCDDDDCYNELSYGFQYEDGDFNWSHTTLGSVYYLNEDITHLFDDGDFKKLESVIESKIFEFGEKFGSSNHKTISLHVNCEGVNSTQSVHIQKIGVFKISEIEERYNELKKKGYL